MGIFNFLSRKTNNKKTGPFVFVHAPDREGFEKYPLVVYGNRESERNNEHFRDCDMTGKKITFELGKSDTYKKPFLIARIDGLKVGAVFYPEQVEPMLNGKIESVYIDHINLCEYKNNKIISHYRIQPYVKYKK